MTFSFGYDIMPRNSLLDCKKQYLKTENEIAANRFCECIHTKGKPLDECLEGFEREKNRSTMGRKLKSL